MVFFFEFHPRTSVLRLNFGRGAYNWGSRSKAFVPSLCCFPRFTYWLLAKVRLMWNILFSVHSQSFSDSFDSCSRKMFGGGRGKENIFILRDATHTCTPKRVGDSRDKRNVSCQRLFISFYRLNFGKRRPPDLRAKRVSRVLFLGTFLFLRFVIYSLCEKQYFLSIKKFCFVTEHFVFGSFDRYPCRSCKNKIPNVPPPRLFHGNPAHGPEPTRFSH